MKDRQVSDNFHLRELWCHHCESIPDELISQVEATAKYIDHAVRQSLGLPVKATSCYRCPTHNAQTPGAHPSSYHLTGKAVDFVVLDTRWPPLKVAGWLEAQIAMDNLPEGGIGIYETFVHYDWRGYRRRF